jgi:beta-phosphoglucomutase-like phosphatase (HAD superfamily)
MSELQALLFDVDGTLADTERDGHRVAFNQAFADAGLDWNWDIATYGQLLKVTGGKERIRYFIDEFQAAFDAPVDLDGFIRSLHQAKTRHFVALLKSGAIPLRPGVERLLNEARAAGLRLGIASTTTLENVTALLRATLGDESIEWFEVIAAGDVVPEKKPEPDIYYYVMEQLALASANCFAIEDSENGLLSSTTAGIKTLVTVNGYTRQHDFDGAAIVLDQLGEPDAGFTVIAGDAGEATYVDVPFIKRLFT